MVFSENGQPITTSREGEVAEALKSISAHVPQRFVATFILITGYGHSWRERASELGVSPGAIGYQLRRVRAALERLADDERSRAKESV